MSNQPQFRTVLRGFDPAQVAEALNGLRTSLLVARRTAADRTLDLSAVQLEIQELHTQLDAHRARVAELEQALSSAHGATYGDFGARIGAMLSLAEEEAEGRRASAAADAQQVREAADAEAMRMRSAAQLSADEIVQRAMDQAAATRAEAEVLLHERTQQVERAQVDIAQERDSEWQRVTEELEGIRSQHEEHLAGLRAQAANLANELEAARQQSRQEAADVLDLAHAEADQLRRDREQEVAELRTDSARIYGHLSRLHRVLGQFMEQLPVPVEDLIDPEMVSAAPDQPIGHRPLPTDLPGLGHWYIERKERARSADVPDEVWEESYDRRDQIS